MAIERLLEKSLDDQYAMERSRQAAASLINRRLNWTMLPLGIAFAAIAYYMDISTRIAIPVLVEAQASTPFSEVRPGYEVFRLDIWAYLRMAPSAIIAGVAGAWFAVFMGTRYGRNFVAVMYSLTGLIYAASFTALLGILIPLNVLVLNKLGLEVTDSEIPFSNEITSFGTLPSLFPLSYIVTGMERGIWAAVAVIVLVLIAVRLSGGLAPVSGFVKSVMMSTAISLVSIGLLLFGPIGFQQFLFDRFIQPPDDRGLIETINDELSYDTPLLVPYVRNG